VTFTGNAADPRMHPTGRRWRGVPLGTARPERAVERRLVGEPTRWSAADVQSLGRRREDGHMRVVALVVLGLIVGTACGKPLFTPPSRLSDFDPGDPRRELVGHWQIELAGTDSVARGKLELTDSVGKPIDRTLLGRLAIDLTPVLGDPMECLEWGTGSVWIARTAEWLALAFAARPTHCWLNASARWYGDSAVGQWRRDTQIGKSDSGRFRMWRLPSS
jgi:hypothetical protein